ncbi:hypothetical protein DDW04_00785 [Sulfolobales archaeon SCGC AB-777_K09]|nr:hypothetical protein DDW04_00785 [Sulfolobales archaeon SCGC AB-777_K09]
MEARRRRRKPFELSFREEGDSLVMEVVAKKRVSVYRLYLTRAEADPEKVREEAYRGYRAVLERVKQRRRPAVLAKFSLYVYSSLASLPLYRALKAVEYERGGIKRVLSANAFVKSTYKMAPVFEEALGSIAKGKRGSKA